MFLLDLTCKSHLYVFSADGFSTWVQYDFMHVCAHLPNGDLRPVGRMLTESYCGNGIEPLWNRTMKSSVGW